jgi:hypothetical protein
VIWVGQGQAAAMRSCRRRRVFEADFEPVSHGFRPLRGAQDANRRDLPLRDQGRTVKAKIRALTRRTSQQDLGYVLTQVNQVIHGWAGYFRHTIAKSVFSMLTASGAGKVRQPAWWVRSCRLAESANVIP